MINGIKPCIVKRSATYWSCGVANKDELQALGKSPLEAYWKWHGYKALALSGWTPPPVKVA